MIARTVSRALEWIRPTAISLVIFCAYLVGNNPQARFHIMGPFLVMIMSGSVAFRTYRGRERIGVASQLYTISEKCRWFCLSKHPSLHFKQIKKFWSVRIGLRYRALGVSVPDGVVWFWIGHTLITTG